MEQKRVNIRARDVRLRHKPVRDVDPKKMESISRNYCTIALQYIGYYPAPITFEYPSEEPKGTAVHVSKSEESTSTMTRDV